MKQKIYKYAKPNCKICTVFANYPKLLDELDWDIVQGLNYLIFLKKYNKVLVDLDINMRLVSSNFYRHKHHMLPERRAELIKLMGEGMEDWESLHPNCEDLKKSYNENNLFLKTTFNQRLNGLSDVEKILERRRKEAIKFYKSIEEIDKKILEEKEDSNAYNKLVLKRYRVKKELDSLESTLRNYVKDVWGLSSQIEDTYRKKTAKFDENDLEGELKKRLNIYFFQLNNNINDFITLFRAYLEWDEFDGDRMRSNSILNHTTKILTETITKSIHNSVKLLPSGDISSIPGVKAVEDTLESLKVLDSGKSDQQA